MTNLIVVTKDRHLRLLWAAERALTILSDILADEKCDHSVGICWCEAFRARDDLAKALRETES
jgi:hypothetical protein